MNPVLAAAAWTLSELESLETKRSLKNNCNAAGSMCCNGGNVNGDNDNDNDDDVWPPLPKGSEHIIQQVAAEHILFELLENKLKNPGTVDFRWIGELATLYPGICHRQYDFNWDDGHCRRLYPLAMLCCLKPPLFVIEKVYNAYPDAVKALESTRGSLPLHYLSAFESTLDVVQFIYSKYEQAVSTARKDNVYCIHLSLVYYRGEPSVANFLLDKFPDGASKLCGNSYWTTAHSAASGRVCDEALLNRLYGLHPDGICALDSHFQTPLHLSCEERSQRNPAPLLRFFIQTAPETLAMEDRLGLTPLFLAAIHQSASTLETLLDLAPNVATVHPRSGATLLHWAGTHNSVPAIECLARRFPHMLTAQTSDSERDTPLSCACFNSAPLENIRALVRCGPQALTMLDGRGRTLLEGARACNVNWAILEVLREATEQTRKKESSKHSQHVDHEEVFP